ncbi:MAG TPA: hypothetical protein VLH86_03180 [Patescibacteria group bacterium]|nr:hypothetical protein [Patescibacteria group bacterium]
MFKNLSENRDLVRAFKTPIILVVIGLVAFCLMVSIAVIRLTSPKPQKSTDQQSLLVSSSHTS